MSVSSHQGSQHRAVLERSVEEVFPTKSSRKEEKKYERFITEKASSTVKSDQEEKSFLKQLKQQRETQEDDWEEPSGSYNAPVVLEEDDVEFIEQLKRKTEESMRSIDEQVQKFKERKQNFVTLTVENQDSRVAQPEKENKEQVSESLGKRRNNVLPSYVKPKVKKATIKCEHNPSTKKDKANGLQGRSLLFVVLSVLNINMVRPIGICK
eukprot:jgi/Galph1/3608/GphlegSOOS_G2266.1